MMEQRTEATRDQYIALTELIAKTLISMATTAKVGGTPPAFTLAVTIPTITDWLAEIDRDMTAAFLTELAKDVQEGGDRLGAKTGAIADQIVAKAKHTRPEFTRKTIN